MHLKIFCKGATRNHVASKGHERLRGGGGGLLNGHVAKIIEKIIKFSPKWFPYNVNYNPKICPLSTITIPAPVIVPRNDKHKKPENLTKRWGIYQKIHPMTMNDFPSEEEDDDDPINIKIVH